VTTIFAARNDAPAMLLMMMPESQWQDGGEQTMEELFASMK
jgi:hypothetical protein